MPGCLFLDLEEGCKLTGCTCNFEGGCEDYLGGLILKEGPNVPEGLLSSSYQRVFMR